MSQKPTPIRVFISSPGDLSIERGVVKALLKELGDAPPYRGRYTFLPYAYEDFVPSIVGESPQDVVDMYLAHTEESDIFVCMMWFRMGTPLRTINPETKKPYQSGTEYEFLTAYRAYEERKKPKILLYRCERSQKPDEIDHSQANRVKKFFAQFRKGGRFKGVIQKFEQPEDLARLLRHDLEILIEKHFKEVTVESIFGSQVRELIFLPNNLPVQYVERAMASYELRRILLSNTGTSRTAIIIITGLGGVGKTVLAQAVCEDSTVQGAFPDGILWANVGQGPNLSRNQREWITALGGDVSAASSIDSGRVELKRLLKNRKMVLVLDNVWDVQDVEPLNVGAPGCTMLITSRQVLPIVGAKLLPLELMNPDESRALLLKTHDGNLDDKLIETISKRVGYLPLALSLIGSQLTRGRTWDDLQKALDKGKLEFVGHRQGGVLDAIKSSVDYLPPDDQPRYKELIVFPKGERLVEAAVQRLWHQTAGLEDFECRILFSSFRDWSLIQSNDTIHDLVFDYLQRVVSAAQVQELHNKLVDSYGQQIDWTILPKGDYAWRYLALHLSSAKRFDDLRSLLTNATYLQNKLLYEGVVSVLVDYALMVEDDVVQSLLGATRQGAHVLGTAPTELLNQLNGRLGSIPDLHTLPVNKQPHFRLESQTLTQPGGPLLRMLKGHDDFVRGCAFSNDGRYILSASADKTVRLWDSTSGFEQSTFQGHTERVERCAFSPDGRYVLSASWDRTLRLWERATGRTRHIFEGHSAPLRGCAYSPDGRTVLSASEDQTLRLWSVESGEHIRSFTGHSKTVHGCAFSPDGKHILSASDDATLRLWDVASGDLIRIFERHDNQIHGCAFSPDGQFAVSASDDKTLRLWDIATGECVQIFQGHKEVIHGCAFSPDGSLLLSASNDGTLRLWDVATGATRHILKGHSKNVTGCAFGPDGRTVVSAAGDKMLFVWDITKAYPERPIESHTDYIADCALSKDGQLAISASGDGTLRLWDLPSNQTISILKGHEDGVFGCTFSPDGKFVLSASRDATLRLWDTATATTVHIFRGHSKMVEDCVFSPDGRFILSASEDKTLKLWDVATRSELHSFEDHGDQIRECTISPDGRLAASTSNDNTVRIWDLASRKLMQTLEGHKDKNIVRCCCFSPDSKFLLSGDNHNDLRLWDIESGTTIRFFEGHTDWVRGCKFSSDGRFALSASSDQTVCLWNIESGTKVAQFSADEALRCCDFDYERRRAIVGDRAGNLHFLRLENI